jgi:hypothetical protein
MDNGIQSKIINVFTTLSEGGYGVIPQGVTWLAVQPNEGVTIDHEVEETDRTARIAGSHSPSGKTTGKKSSTSSVTFEVTTSGLENGRAMPPSYKHYMVSSCLRERVATLIECSGTTGTWVIGDTVASAATKGSLLGNVNLTGGHDWLGTSQSFSVTVNGVGPTEVTLDSTCADLAAVVSEINASLATAGITTAEAYSSGNFAGLRTTTTGATKIIVLAAGGTALTTLGWTAGTYTGTDSASGSLLDFKNEGSNKQLVIISENTYNASATITGTGGASATVVTANKGTIYTLTSKTSQYHDMIALIFNGEGRKYLIPGTFNDMTMTFEVGKVPTVQFTSTGTYNKPADDVQPVGTTIATHYFPALSVPITIGDINQDYICISKIELKLAAENSKPSCMSSATGIPRIFPTGRKPSVSIDPIATEILANFDLYQMSEDGRYRVELDVGKDAASVAGKRYRLCFPYCEFKFPKPADRDGMLSYNVEITPCGVLGDDEFYFMYY